MKDVKVLGSGCCNCEITANAIAQAAKDAGVEIELEKVTDIAEIMSTPGVVVDGKLDHSGGIPGSDLVRVWLRDYLVSVHNDLVFSFPELVGSASLDPTY